MADELRIVARYDDQGVGKGLEKLRGELAATTRVPGLDDLRKRFGDIEGTITRLRQTGAQFNTAGGIGGMLGLGNLTGIASVAGLAASMRDLARTQVEMRHFSKETGIAAGHLRELQALGQKFQIDPGAVTGNVTGFADKLNDIRRGLGSTYGELAQKAPQLAKELRESTDNFEALGKALGWLQKQGNAQDQKRWANELGLGDMTRLFTDGEKALRDAWKEVQASGIGKPNPELEKQSKAFTDALNRFDQSVETMKRTWGPSLLGEMANAVERLSGAFGKFADAYEKFRSGRPVDALKTIDEATDLGVGQRKNAPPSTPATPLDEQLDAQMRGQAPQSQAEKDRAGRIAAAEGRLRKAQEDLGYQQRRFPLKDEGAIKVLSEEVRKLIEELRRLREDGGATRQGVSFDGGGAGGLGGLIQKASLGGGFGGGRGFGGGGGGGFGPDSSYGAGLQPFRRFREGVGGGGSGGSGPGQAVPDTVPMTAGERNTLGLIMKYESRGRNTMNYVGKGQGLDPTTAKGYTAQGYYQMLNSNWRRIAPLYGIKTPNAMASSLEEQTKVALHLLRHGGIGNWSNYNPALRAALARGEQAPAGVAGGEAAGGDAAGLRLKSAEATAGGPSASGLTSLLKSLQDGGLPGGFNRVTALNDAFHHRKNPGSMHTKGLAGDITLSDARRSAEAAAAIRERLRAAGLTDRDFHVRDEYLYPSKHSSGGHIHTQFNTHEAAERYRAYVEAELKKREASRAGGRRPDILADANDERRKAGGGQGAFEAYRAYVEAQDKKREASRAGGRRPDILADANDERRKTDGGQGAFEAYRAYVEAQDKKREASRAGGRRPDILADANDERRKTDGGQGAFEAYRADRERRARAGEIPGEEEDDAKGYTRWKGASSRQQRLDRNRGAGVPGGGGGPGPNGHIHGTIKLEGFPSSAKADFHGGGIVREVKLNRGSTMSATEA